MGAERKIVQKRCFFVGKRYDNNILKVQILLSRNFIVIVQAAIGDTSNDNSHKTALYLMHLRQRLVSF